MTSKKLRRTHNLRVEDVSIEWPVQKHDYAQSKSRRCEIGRPVEKHSYVHSKDVRLNTAICYDVSGNLHLCKYGCY